MTGYLLILTMFLANSSLPPIELPGLPLQIEWSDIDGDGLVDLVALMLQSQTEGHVDTFFEDGGLKGFYEDETFKEKLLLTFLQKESGWQETARMDLGRESILGIAISHSADSANPELVLWTTAALIRHRRQDGAWKAFMRLATPGIMGGDQVSLTGFRFWQITDQGPLWLVPDFGGIHLISADRSRPERFVEYPRFAVKNQRANSHSQEFTFTMPQLLAVDGDSDLELVFSDRKEAIVWWLDTDKPPKRALFEGHLADMNGDGMVDLIQVEEGDVDRMKDLPLVKSTVRTYLATAPLTFAEEPTANQEVPGMVFENSGSDIDLVQPFIDLNRDGRMDLVGIAFKFSMWQVAKLVSLGRFTMKFLISLNVQEVDGSFRTLTGGPFPLEWNINLRKLKMPELAQFAADLNGDGWSDVLMVRDGHTIEMTPVDSAGFHPPLKWTRAIDKQFKDPDQVFGRDLNGDGKAELVILKVLSNRSLIQVMESK